MLKKNELISYLIIYLSEYLYDKYNMIKKMIKWFNSLNEIDRELAKQGIFNFHTMYGTFTYTDKALTTHINSNDDKQRTIPENNR